MQTAKQAAEILRSRIKECCQGPGMRYTHPVSGLRTEVCLPTGLTYRVRATKSGVNVTIEDGYPSYIGKATGGDRRKWSKEYSQPVIEEVDKLRNLWEPALPGETKMGLVVIAAHATTVTSTDTGETTVIRPEWLDES
jgi:hypothetical protein